jgi:hypothetical protein
MTCHYCHSNDHIINDCPNIVCHYCKKSGHPKWLCKNKNDKLPKKKIQIKNNIEKNLEFYLKLENKKWSEIIN